MTEPGPLVPLAFTGRQCGIAAGPEGRSLVRFSAEIISLDGEETLAPLPVEK